MVPFAGTVFHTLSHNVIGFVASVSSKNHLLTGWNSFDSQSVASIQWFLKLTLTTKRITPCERGMQNCAWNWCLFCVKFCLRSLGRFERCEYFQSHVRVKFISRKMTCTRLITHIESHQISTNCKCRRKWETNYHNGKKSIKNNLPVCSWNRGWIWEWQLSGPH